MSHVYVPLLTAVAFKSKVPLKQIGPVFEAVTVQLHKGSFAAKTVTVASAKPVAIIPLPRSSVPVTV